MLKKQIALCAFVCLATSIFVPAISAQDKTEKPKETPAASATDFKIPPEDAKKANPLKNDASCQWLTAKSSTARNAWSATAKTATAKASSLST